MLWIVQEDLHAKTSQYGLIHALERLGIEHVMVKVGKNSIEPNVEVAPGQAVITNGSIMLSKIARERGWTPGGFMNDNFSYKVWAEHYGSMILNKDAKVGALGGMEIQAGHVFARPVLDDKSFNGRVFERAEFLKMQQASLRRLPGFPSPDTEVAVSAPKSIGQEHRHYIVDGVVVSSSRYKLAGKANFSEGADPFVLDAVKRAIGLWVPARAFVLDTYVQGPEVGIVELGGIGHAGVYEADLMKIVWALDSMPMSCGTLPRRGSGRRP